MAVYNSPDQIDASCIAHQLASVKWQLIDDLKGGTLAMRAAGERWLPKEPKEQPEQYQVRLQRSFLYAAYSDTVDRLVSKPFSKSVILENSESLDPVLQEVENDVDKSGTTLTSFARALFESGIDYGVAHILVDYPMATGSESKSQEQEQGLRPVLVLICAKNLIGWRYRQGPSGELILSQIRIRYSEVESTGNYGEHEVEYIRVYTEQTWELWKKTIGDESHVMVGSGNHTFGAVPLVSLYMKKTQYLCGEPALEDLAWLNVAHWQSSSDQRNILRFARVGILFGKGFSQEEVEKGLVIGPQKIFGAENPEADLKYVEHTGKSIESGRQDLLDLETRMETLGLQPLIRRTGDKTATERVADESRTETDIQRWARDTEFAIHKSFEHAAKWIGKELPKDFRVNIFNEFGLNSRISTDVTSIKDARVSGDISRFTYLTELKRRAILDESLNIEEEMTRIEEEGPNLNLVGEVDTENEEDPEEYEDDEENFPGSSSKEDKEDSAYS